MLIRSSWCPWATKSEFAVNGEHCAQAQFFVTRSRKLFCQILIYSLLYQPIKTFVSNSTIFHQPNRITCSGSIRDATRAGKYEAPKHNNKDTIATITKSLTYIATGAVVM